MTIDEKLKPCTEQLVCKFSEYFDKVVSVLETISDNLPFYYDYAVEMYYDSKTVMAVRDYQSLLFIC